MMAASSPKPISLLFLLLIALFSLQTIHAREFFSKVPSVNSNDAKETTTTKTIPNTQMPGDSFVPETQKTVPNKEAEYVTKSEQEPTFIPQTQTQSGYGLYGRDTAGDDKYFTTPSSTSANTKVTYASYVTPIHSDSQETYNSNKNNYYDKNTYETEQQNLGDDTRFAQKGYSSMANEQNNYYNFDDQRQGTSFDTRFNSVDDQRQGTSFDTRFNSVDDQRQGTSFDTRFNRVDDQRQDTSFDKRYNNVDQRPKYENAERQGMSDTRFMEDGKYFYDVKEKNYQNQYESSRGVASRNDEYYNTRSNRGKYFYGNNENSYKNQVDFEDSQEDFEP